MKSTLLRTLRRGLTAGAALAMLAGASTAHATYIANASADLDLSNLSVTFTGTSFNWTGDSYSSYAESYYPYDAASSFSAGSVTSTASHPGYSGTATATSNVTRVGGTVGVVDADAGGDNDGAWADSYLTKGFSTTGAGSLTISIPYTLSYDLTGTDQTAWGETYASVCSQLAFTSYQYDNEQTTATINGIDEITGSRSGVLTLTKHLLGDSDGSLYLSECVYAYGDGAPSAPVPEPGSMVLVGTGFLGLAIYGKRRKNA